MRLATRTAALTMALSLTGCVMEGEPADGSEEVDSVEQAIFGGFATNVRPEVGVFNGVCTATLISPRHFITAAHCIGFAEEASGGSMTFNRTDGTQAGPFAIDKVVAFDSANGFFDVALGRLAAEVPAADVPTLASLAIARPPAGTSASVFGYGCSEFGSFGTKRTRSFSWHDYSQSGTSSFLCPGDSGGPVFQGNPSSGLRIFAINSHGYGDPPLDGFADAAMFTHRYRIAAQIAAWEGGVEPGWDRPGLDITSLPAASAIACSWACAQNASCSAFSFVTATGTCWLKKAGSAPVPTRGVTSGILNRNEVGVDRPGFDFASGVAFSSDSCRSRCYTNARCAAYTFVRSPVSSSGTCYLKDTDATPVSSSSTNLISGVRREWLAGVHRPGSDIDTFEVGTRSNVIDGGEWYQQNRPRPEYCQAACFANSSCYSWTLESSPINGTNRCWLKGAAALATPYASAAGLVSGDIVR